LAHSDTQKRRRAQSIDSTVSTQEIHAGLHLNEATERQKDSNKRRSFSVSAIKSSNTSPITSNEQKHQDPIHQTSNRQKHKNPTHLLVPSSKTLHHFYEDV
jgi:hypothetical protein